MSHFHTNHDLIILFEKWRGNTLSEHILFAFAAFVVSVAHEFLRAYMKYQTYVRAQQRGRYSMAALVASLLYQINFIIGYGLMLIVMLYSILLFAAIVAGAGLGYFIAQPAYGLIVEHAKSGIYYVKHTRAKTLAELETERLDTSFCPAGQLTYV